MLEVSANRAQSSHISEERNVTCDDKIAIAFAAGILALPAMVVWFLLWELYVAEKIYRLRLRLAMAIRGRL